MITKVQSYFLDYPAESKLWIFMAERQLSGVEADVVKTFMTQFVPQWKAHSDALKAGFELIEDRFLVVVVDETPAAASGCSIDSLTRFIKEIESKTGVSFTNRMLVTYQQNSEFITNSLSDFKKKVKNGQLADDTIIYNNSVATLSDFWDNWEQPLNKSWAATLLP